MLSRDTRALFTSLASRGRGRFAASRDGVAQRAGTHPRTLTLTRARAHHEARLGIRTFLFLSGIQNVDFWKGTGRHILEVAVARTWHGSGVRAVEWPDFDSKKAGKARKPKPRREDVLMAAYRALEAQVCQTSDFLAFPASLRSISGHGDARTGGRCDVPAGSTPPRGSPTACIIQPSQRIRCPPGRGTGRSVIPAASLLRFSKIYHREHGRTTGFHGVDVAPSECGFVMTS
jgi:hypothetical protein